MPRGGIVKEALDAAGLGLRAAEEMFDERFDRRGHALGEGLRDDADAGVLVSWILLAEAVAQVGDGAFVGDADVAVRAGFADDQRGFAAVGAVMRDGRRDVATGEDVAVPDDEVLVVRSEQAGDVGQAAAGLEEDGFMDELHFGFAETAFREGERPGFGAMMRVDEEAARTGGAELLHRLQDHRTAGDREQRLRAVFGERTQTRAEAGSEEEGGAGEIRHGKRRRRRGRCRRLPSRASARRSPWPWRPLRGATNRSRAGVRCVRNGGR